MVSHQHKTLFNALYVLINALYDMAEDDGHAISGEKLELIQRILELQNTLHGMDVRPTHCTHAHPCDTTLPVQICVFVLLQTYPRGLTAYVRKMENSNLRMR